MSRESDTERFSFHTEVRVRLPETDAMAFSQLMLRNGVALIAGPLLAVNEGIATNHIRIPYYRNPSVLERALEQMAVVWKNHHG